MQVCKIINAELFQDQAPLKLFFYTELKVNQGRKLCLDATLKKILGLSRTYFTFLWTAIFQAVSWRHWQVVFPRRQQIFPFQ